MPRIKRGKSHLKRRKNILKSTKGYLGRRKKLIKAAKEARTKAETYAFRDRKAKKRNMRRLWNIRINAALREQNTNYSIFIAQLKKNNIELDRKVLATLAAERPEIFTKIIQEVSK